METDIRTTTTIPQYTIQKETLHAVNLEFICFGNATCFYFQSVNSFVTK